MGGYDHDKKSFEQAVIKINDLHPDFVLICGDLINAPSDSTYIDFLKIRKKLAAPCFCIPGNHDMGNTPTNAAINYYRKIIGKDYYSFYKKGYYFIGVNTQLWKSSVEGETDKHDEWFKRTLIKLGKKNRPIIVFGHIPLYISDVEEKEGYSNLAPQKRKEILGLLKRNDVKVYLSGHSHTIIINDYKGIKLISGETTSKNFDKRPLGFRLWNLSSDSISHQFIPIEKE